MKDFITNNFKYFLIALIVFFSVVFIAILYIHFKKIMKYNKKTRLIVTGIDDNAKVKNLKTVKEKTKKVKIKEPALKTLVKEYIFFGGSKTKFIASLIIGYLVFYVIFFIVSSNFIIAAILALAYFDLFYIVIDKKNEKNRKNYIKGFSLALRTLTASVEAGNSFPEAVTTIMKRETINEKIRTEFAYLNNNLKSTKSLNDALDEFWQRNHMFGEFSMFVIVMQFYASKGGSGLAQILLKLEKTLENKVESYSEVDTELGIHKTLMNILNYGYFIVLLFVKLFMNTFYVDLANTVGYLKCLGSVACLYIATIYFKSMVRNAAEG